MEKHVTDQLIKDLGNAAMFSICLDESTDVILAARLAVFARFPSGNKIKNKEFSQCNVNSK